MIFGLFRGSTNRRVVERLHLEVVTAARNPLLFTDYGIADDVEGRFESVALHAALVLRRLKQLPAPGPDIAQDLADTLFRHFDRALREMGVGDMSVPKRMKQFAQAFFGRASAYDAALSQGRSALCEALSRNVYGDRRDADRLALYVEGLADALARSTLAQFVEGPIFEEKRDELGEEPARCHGTDR